MKKQQLTLILCQSRIRHNQGFSMFEILVAIFVSSAFLMGTLQAVTINTVLQVKTEREAKASFWIQEELDELQAAASGLTLTNPNDCDNTIAVDSRFGAQLKDQLNAELDEDSDNLVGIDSNEADPETYFVGPGNFLQYKMDGKGNHEFDSSGNPTFVTVKDSKDNSITKQGTVQVIGDQDLVNKPYRLVRIITLDSASNFDVLQVYYRVGEPHIPGATQDNDNDQLADDERGKTSIITKNYSEVIPAAVSECT